MKLQFIEDIERDIRNWQSSVTTNSYGMDWVKFLPPDISIQEVSDSEYLKIYLERKFYRPGKVSAFKNWIERATKTSQLQNDLEKLMGQKTPVSSVKIFITTFHRAPYNIQQCFFYLIWRDSDKEKAVTNIYHELMHFFFHIYYWKMCQKAGLSDVQIHVLKESLTVLLSPILEKRGLPIDRGYAKHQVIRTELEKLWDKEKNFKSFLRKIISIKDKLFLI